MSEFPLCTRKTISVLTNLSNKREIDAWCFGDLAVAQPLHLSSGWTIFHVPSGSSIMSCHCLFRYKATAVEAMMEISRLKNRWIFDDQEEMLKLREAISEIGKKHGGVALDRGHGRVAFRQDLNGYDKED